MPPLHKRNNNQPRNRPNAATQAGYDTYYPHAYPTAQSYNPCRATPAYVLIADECGAVHVADPDALEVIACVGADAPAGLAIDCELHRLYATNAQGSVLTVIDSECFQVLNVVALQKQHNACPAVMNDIRSVVNLNNHRVYIPQPDSGSLAVVSGFRNCLMGIVQVGGSPVAVAVNQRTNLVYIANYTNEMPIVNSNNSCLVGAVALPGQAAVTDVIADNCDNRIYALRDDGSLTVIDGAANCVIQALCIPSGAATFALDQSLGLLYVINAAQNAVLVFDTCMLEQVGKLEIPHAPCQRFAQLAVNVLTHVVYVSDSCCCKTYVVDGGMNTFIGEIPAAGQALEVLCCAQNCPPCVRGCCC